MGASREGKNIWFYLFGRWLYNGRWRGWDLFRRRWWQSPYIWHDSFGKYINRWLRCPFVGCVLTDISDAETRKEFHCFYCERTQVQEERRHGE